jgi:putative membrane protein
MARAIRPVEKSIPESFEGEMRVYGLSSETELRGLNHPPFHKPGISGRDVALGALAGAISGLVACWVMVQFQKGWSKAEEAAQQRNSNSRNLHENNVPEHRAVQPEGEQQEQPDDATIKTAEAISEGLFGHRLSREEKKVAGPVVHYAFGTLTGALYGVAAEVAPATRAGFGTAFGTAVFIGADEIAVPALGLSPSTKGVPLSKHIYGWVSHLVYGVTTEAVRRPVRRALM